MAVKQIYETQEVNIPHLIEEKRSLVSDILHNSVTRWHGTHCVVLCKIHGGTERALSDT